MVLEMKRIEVIEEIEDEFGQLDQIITTHYQGSFTVSCIQKSIQKPESKPKVKGKIIIEVLLSYCDVFRSEESFILCKDTD